MNFLPLVGFYYRRHEKISALLSEGSAGSSRIVLDLVKALAPVIKKHWPQYNEDGLLDDAISTLEEVIGDKTSSDFLAYPDPTQR